VSTAVNLDERQRRIAQNEALCRKVNERINDVQEALSAFTGTLEIVCECGTIECAELLSITRPQTKPRHRPALLRRLAGRRREPFDLAARSFDHLLQILDQLRVDRVVGRAKRVQSCR
jgi:hypothetical protein